MGVCCITSPAADEVSLELVMNTLLDSGRDAITEASFVSPQQLGHPVFECFDKCVARPDAIDGTN